MALGGWYYFSGLTGSDDLTIHDAPDEAVAQYDLAHDKGSALEVCVSAGSVADAYLQHQDQENYQRWKQTEKADCAKAGVQK